MFGHGHKSHLFICDLKLEFVLLLYYIFIHFLNLSYFSLT
jgi:hypothetical protein